jgi:3-methyladenine DNA glycosylase/8-oxoguanine DNA glycosylase
MHLDLLAQPPFLFHSTVRSHGWYQLAPLHWSEEEQVLRWAERLDDGSVLSLSATAIEGGVRITAPALSPAQRDDVRARIAWMFHLDADFSAFYARADAEPRLRHCRPLAQGRMLRSSTLFTDVVKMMLTTNIQWSSTKRLARALVDHYGDATDDGQRAFPTAERIARSRETILRKLGLGYRAPYLLKLAREVAAGRIDVQALCDRTIPTVELRRRLLALPGIGPYASAALLALLGRHDFIPIDTEAVAAVSQHFYGGAPVGAKEINAVFDAWGEHKALAYWFWDYNLRNDGKVPGF